MAEASDRNDRIAVFFHFFEASHDYTDNLIFFLTVAYLEEVDFFVILSSDCSVTLPQKRNITYIRAANRNRDYGGYAAALAGMSSLSNYDIFIFVNSSARGPFSRRAGSRNWTTLFTGLLTDDVRLVGSTINILSDRSWTARRYGDLFERCASLSHVQTPAYALDRTALEHLLAIGFFDTSETLDRLDVICRYEIRLSQEILKQGWNIRCCLPEYNRIDYRQPHANINPATKMGDVAFKGAYFARTAHPDELVFVKTNRNMLSKVALASHTYTALCAHQDRVDQWDAARALQQRALDRISKRVRLKRGCMKLLSLSGLRRFKW